MDRESLPKPRTIAVTGTNGKTTTTSMVAAIVEAAAEPSALITTLGMWVDGEPTAADKSMRAFDATWAAARRKGVRSLALEVTSKALSEGFAARHRPDVAVFTNLSHDHLDRHGSPEAYLAAKAQLFLHLPPNGVAVLNAADPTSELLSEILPAGVRVLRFAATHVDVSLTGQDLSAQRISESAAGLTVTLAPSELANALGGRLNLPLGGAFNVDNALAAALATWAAGYAPQAIAAGLGRFCGVPGRFQLLADRPLVLVDFAHSPDALERVLRSARTLAEPRGGALWCVFGCGGGRDRHKRPVMGGLAERMCDRVVVTSDNPRLESPEAIIGEVLSGMSGDRAETIADRRAAILHAVSAADAHDVVVIAGRGPEQTQETAAGPCKLSDVDVARQALAQRKQ